VPHTSNAKGQALSGDEDTSGCAFNHGSTKDNGVFYASSIQTAYQWHDQEEASNWD
jgi:hypothetical protein